MVASQASLIRENGPSRPFFLAGFSSDGVLAFEVAHLLHKTGMPAAGVFLFDADMKAPRFTTLRIWTMRHARKVRDQGFDYLVAKVRRRLQRRRGQQAGTPIANESEDPDAPWRVHKRIWDHMLKRYRPRPLAAPGVLFRAKVSIYVDVHDHDGCLGWNDLFTEGLKVIEIPGDHDSMWKEPDALALLQSWEFALGKLRSTTHAVLCSAPTVLAAIACSV
jgi:thioesterase domain-containing protein